MAEKPALFLDGKRLYLRTLEVGDLDRARRWMNDPEVRRYLLCRVPIDEVSERTWFDGRNRGPFPTDIVLAIVLKRGHRHIGSTGIHQINWIDRHATTGAVIGEADCWNRGYGSEAKALVLRYCFETLGLHRVCSAVLATNGRSLAYLKKSGYREEGRFREHTFRDGGWIDEVRLSILADEWQALEKKKKR